MAGVTVPSQAGPHPTEFQLSVGEGKILQFKKKPQIAAVAELVWNALDANATLVDVELRREWDAITQIVVTDNGHGMTPERARAAFEGYGETWKTGKTHTQGNTRILHGRNGEGRLYALALGDRFTWESVAEVDGRLVGVWISGNADHSTVWQAQETAPARDKTGTTVRIDVPQGKTLRGLERQDAAANLTARLAFYLRAYPDVSVTFDGKRLDPSDIIVGEPIDLPLNLPEEYAQEDPAPVVTFVEWNQRMSDRRMLICNADGIALYGQGREWSDSIVSFTPYLRSNLFNDISVDDLHGLPMSHGGLLDAAAKAVQEHLSPWRPDFRRGCAATQGRRHLPLLGAAHQRYTGDRTPDLRRCGDRCPRCPPGQGRSPPTLRQSHPDCTEPSPSSNVLVGGPGVRVGDGTRAGRWRESAA
ncbi:ATP-binding protein, partial [Streptomyces antibioticus]|uniref:ATP-binding protein n=1 Tax=Streptomyces antibioticus TaxID=1890 RepID=UPI0033F57329